MTDSDVGSEWWALLAPTATDEPTGWVTVSHDRWRALDREYRFGGLSIRTAATELIDYVPSLHLGWSQRSCWPIVVRGESSGQVFAEAAGSVLPPLHRLCTLLAIEWAEPWQIRVAPTDLRALPVEVPEPAVPESWHEPRRTEQRDPQPLPGRVLQIWDRLKLGEADALGAALSLWHQGILLMRQHPSFAFVAFTAAIEAVASSPPVADQVGGLPNACPECKFVGGSGARFRRALALVASQEELDELKKAKLYDLRSQTVHGRTLHGIEEQFGARIYLPRNLDDPMQRFMFETLRTVCRISRELVLLALTSAVPRE